MQKCVYCFELKHPNYHFRKGSNYLDPKTFPTTTYYRKKGLCSKCYNDIMKQKGQNLKNQQNQIQIPQPQIQIQIQIQKENEKETLARLIYNWARTHPHREDIVGTAVKGEFRIPLKMQDARIQTWKKVSEKLEQRIQNFK